MTIFDSIVPIHETAEGVKAMDDLLPELENILNYFGIDHCFTYPDTERQEKVRTETGKSLLYLLYYNEEQNTELTLAISLFSKKYLKKPDEKILAAIVKSMSKESNTIEKDEIITAVKTMQETYDSSYLRNCRDGAWSMMQDLAEKAGYGSRFCSLDDAMQYLMTSNDSWTRNEALRLYGKYAKICTKLEAADAIGLMAANLEK